LAPAAVAQQGPSSSGMNSGTGQVDDFAVNLDEAIPIGPFIFSPAVQLSWQDRDNIFFEPDNEVRDQLLLAKARLLFEVPIYESYVRFSYTPQYRDYMDYELEDKWQHFFDVAGAFEFSSGLTLNLSYAYIIGNLETREIDPGGELVWGDRRFDKQRFKFGGDYWLTGRDGITFDLLWEDVDNENDELFYDYTRLAGGIGWLHQISPILVMDLRYGIIDFDAKDYGFVNNDFRDSTSHDVTLGFRGQLSPVVSTELRIGYRQIDYDPTPDQPQVEDFSGAIVNGFLSWEMAHGSVLRLDLLRMPYPSAYADNANYVATGASLSYSLDRGSLYGQLRGRFQNNDYSQPDPIEGEIRSDDITTFGLGLGYRFTYYLSLWGSYLYEDRDTLYRYSYDTNIFTLGLVLGW
ncbi:MAG: outer membrane beta-barrel protein, partial [Acidobacteriota bacterium]